MTPLAYASLTAYLVVGAIVGAIFCVSIMFSGNWAQGGHEREGVLAGVFAGMVVALAWPVPLLIVIGGWLWSRLRTQP